MLKKEIINTIKNSVSKILYYDRKEDQDLPVGAIDDAIKRGVISFDEIISIFSDTLKDSLD